MKKDLKLINKNISVEAFNYINELTLLRAEEENISERDNPFPETFLYSEKIIIKKNKYNTRSFSKKFKLYINDFNISSPNGVYTWMLLNYNGNIVFLCSRAYNKLEIHSKHGFILKKFDD